MSPSRRRPSALALAAALLLGLASASASAQTPRAPQDAVGRAAWTGLHGPDGADKDGPLARVSYDLARLHHAWRAHAAVAPGRAFRAPAPSLHVRRRAGGADAVVVEAIAEASASTLRADLEALGLREAATAKQVVSGWLPLEAVPAAAALPSLRFLSAAHAQVRTPRPARPPAPLMPPARPLAPHPYVAAARPAGRGAGSGVTGRVTSQGDAAQGTGDARATLSLDGAGVTVGVLSDSYDNPSGGVATRAADDIASGDLPPAARIAVLDDAIAASDEGRALMQIVHDVAPGANLAFATAFGGRPRFAANIRALANAGAGVVLDDILYLAEPMFQDGILAEAVEEVTSSHGVVYLSAAGNNGRDSYEAPFRDSGAPGVLAPTARRHDFGGGARGQPIEIEAQGEVTFVVQWDDPFRSLGGPGATSDLDAALLAPNGTVCARAESNNLGADPVEILRFTHDGSAPGCPPGLNRATFTLSLELAAGPAPGRLKYVFFEQRGQTRPLDFATQSPTLYGHPNAPSAISVAAAAWFNTPFNNVDPPRVNSFSSVGGVPVVFDGTGARLAVPRVRPKPDVTGPDGGNTTFFGQSFDDGDAFPNFFGTSAATPHVAGLVALLREDDPARTSGQILAALQRGALDIEQTSDDVMTGSGFDAFSGAGLVRALPTFDAPSEVVAFAVTPTAADRVRVAWTETGAATTGDGVRIERYAVERRTSGPFAEVAAEDGRGARAYEVEAPLDPAARTSYRVRWTRSDGTTGRTAPLAVVPALDGTAEISAFPNPFDDLLIVRVQAARGQTVTTRVYDVLGRRVLTLAPRTLTAGQPTEIVVGAGALRGLASGVYFVHVDGETFEATRRAVRVR